MLKLVYWALVALDACGIGLLFVLGLAAAGSAKTNPLLVALYLLVLPGIPLVLSVVLFVRSGSSVVRTLAFLLAAAPLLIVLVTRTMTQRELAANTNAQGKLMFFKQGPMREIAEAIARNDAATVSALLPQVDINAEGMQETTLLVSALRQLRTTPDQLDVLRVLLKAGADPNKGTEYEKPLSLALQVASKTGPEPVRLLLDAGADPNRPDSFGVPAYFLATGQSSTPEILDLMIAHGANLNAVSPQGQTVLFYASNTRNWNVVHTLLLRGADWTKGKSANGLSFKEMIEGYAGDQANAPGFADVLAFLRSH